MENKSLTIDDLRREGMIIFEVVSGSRAYGLDTPTSDTDIRGVFVLPPHLYYHWDRAVQVNNATNDESFYELDRFVELLSKNNPNILELLAADVRNIIYKHPIFDRLRPEMFLSKLAKESFAGYAMTQVRKARGLKKKIMNPMDEKRREVLDFCYFLDGYGVKSLRGWLEVRGWLQERCGLVAVPHTKGVYSMFYDAEGDKNYSGIQRKSEANEVALSSIPKGAQLAGYIYFNADAYSVYCKEYREYWEWVTHRNEDRYANTMQQGKNYDAKNMMHTFRLLDVAEEILGEGIIRTLRPNREELLAIKAGQFEFDELLLRAQAKMERIEELYLRTDLPAAPDMERINAVLYAMRRDFYSFI